VVLIRAALVIALCAGVAAADPSATLREANAAASAGDWARVQMLVDPLLDPAHPPSPADLAEADRLAGLVAFFAQRLPAAEAYFVAYLKHDRDGRLDPALYPPEVVNYFNDVRARHAGELVVLRPPPKRYWALTLVPPVAQFQNGEKVKGIVVASLLGSFLATNITTYVLLRSWCHDTGNTCDASGKNHYRSAQTLQNLNAFSGVALIFTYAYGVWDGVRGYHRRTMELAPYATSSSVGVSLTF
jgi:hypothetical protein